MNKRQSQFLLIKISQGGLRRLAIPVPLYVVDITINAFSDLAHLIDTVMPKGIQRIFPGGLSVSGIIVVCSQSFQELRKYGRLSLVEVQSGKVRISIDFY